jgi:hypothetical protein
MPLLACDRIHLLVAAARAAPQQASLGFSNTAAQARLVAAISAQVAAAAEQDLQGIDQSPDDEFREMVGEDLLLGSPGFHVSLHAKLEA